MNELSKRLAHLSPKQRELLLKKLQQANREPASEFKIQPRKNPSNYPLSFAQERLWFLQQLAPESPFYNMPMALLIRGKLNQSSLKQAIAYLLDRHEILRSFYITGKDGNPSQKIAKLREVPFQCSEKFLDRETIDQLIKDEVSQPFDLTKAPLIFFKLFKINENESILLINLHHIIADGWSVNVMIDELLRLYRQIQSGKKPLLPEPKLQYADFAEWHNQFIFSPRVTQQLKFWEDYLQGMPQVLEFVTDYPRPAVQNHEGKQLIKKVDSILYQKLLNLAKSLQITPYSLFLAITQLFLLKITGQPDFGVGVPLANRHRKAFEKLVGFFVNTGVVRSNINPLTPFSEFAKRTHQDVLTIAENQDIPFDLIVDKVSKEHDLSRSPLFQVMFDLQRLPFINLKLDEIEISPYDFQIDISKFDLLFLLTDYQNHLKVAIEYNTQIFANDTVSLWANYYMEFMTQVANTPEQLIKDLKLISPTQEKKLISEIRSFRQPYPSDKTVVRLFEDQVKKTPDAVAVRYKGRDFTYQQINNMANQLAHYILNHFPSSKPLIGLLMNKSHLLIVAILGIIKSGKGYLALDPKYPTQRIAFILQDTQTELVITDGEMKKNLPVERVKILPLDEKWPEIENQDEHNPGLTISPEDIIYTMFTSGSTGIPKGVVVPHKAVIRLVFNQNYADFGPEEHIGFLSSIAFDASTFEIWGALLHGAILSIFPHLKPSLSEIARFIIEEEISLQFITTGLFHLLIDEQLDSLVTIKQLLAGGDVLSPVHLKKLFQKMPKGHYFIPVYGPTENTTYTTALKMADLSKMTSTVPIGIPIHNSEVYILDPFLNLVPPGVPGELYAAGDGLAIGYLNRPDLTAERFLPNPFSDKPGDRMYSTGDLVRQRADGIIEFIRRIDQQVKIRGFRVELGEIEHAIKKDSRIKDAIVTTFEETPGDKLLVAYLIAEKKEKKLIEDMKEYLQKELPSYMVPDFFVFMESFPLNISGKVDRRALPRPQLDEIATANEYIPPANALEEYLAKIWQEVLGLERIGIKDNFFDLGGNSLKAAVFINRLQQEFDHEFPVAAVFKAPTIEQLSAYLLEYFDDLVAKKFKLRNNHDKPIDISLDKSIKKVEGKQIETFRKIIRPLPPFDQKTKSKNPPALFILSPPRSGSTLFRIMLAGNPQLFSPPELDLLSFNTLGERKETFRQPGLEIWLEATIRAIMELKKCDYYTAKKLMDEFEKQNMAIKEFYRLLQEWAGGRLLVDKTPTYPFDLNVLQRAEEYFENPFYIHLIRHPYAMIYSFIEAKLDQNFFRYDHPFSRQELAELIWIVSNQNILTFLEKIPEQRKFQLRFEDLLLNPREELQRVCSFLQIEFDEEMLKPYHGNKMTDGARKNTQMVGDFKFYLHRDIDQEVAYKWKKHHKVDFLSDIAWNLAARFNYQVEKNLAKMRSKSSFRITPLKNKANIPLSFSQQRLWFLEQLTPGQAGYNIPIAIRIKGLFDINAVKKAWEQLIIRHESLRTVFNFKNETPVQIIKDYIKSPLQYFSQEQLKNRDIKQIIKEDANKPFDLINGPLLRGMIFTLLDNEFIFYVNMHHIISDGISTGIFIRDLNELYNAIVENRSPDLPDLPVQYADYSVWQRETLKGDYLKKELQFWQEQFKNVPPLLELPYDRPRPRVQTYNGRKLYFELSKNVTQKINALAKQFHTTPFVILLGVFQTLLYRYSQQSTILIGTPVANRNRKEIENLIGFFVNTLVIRTDFNNKMSYADLIKTVKERVSDVFAHQEVPFEKIIDHLKIERSLSYNPLFQVMFAYQPPALASIEFKYFQAEPLELDNNVSKFDMTLSLAEVRGVLKGEWEYNTDLWDQSTIDQMLRHFLNLLNAVLENPSLTLNQYSLLQKKEIEQIVEKFNPKIAKPFPKSHLVFQLLEQQVAKNPHQIAVSYLDQQLSFREFNQKVNQLAHHLIDQGIKPEEIVGILMDRSVEMLISIYAIWKAGAAYLPLDVNYPRERIQYMLQDSGCQFVITRANDQLISIPVITIDFNDPGISSKKMSNPDLPVNPEQLAYIIYTSGSTGKPKGVMVEHRSAINLAYNLKQSVYDLVTMNPIKISLNAPISFDASVQQIVMLAFGHTLEIIPASIRKDAKEFLNYIIDKKIDLIDCVPSQLKLLVDEGLLNLNDWHPLAFLPGGEAIDKQLWDKLKNSKRIQFFNVYGPTECTVDSSICHINISHQSPNIGKPILNTRFYILDEAFNVCPIGVSGQIFISGKGVTRGYLNRPGLTAERFLPDPFLTKSRMYATGDKGRYLSDGSIEFLGRLDTQVKLHGFRIELGEIEHNLKTHVKIKDAIVIVKDEKLVAYIIPNQKELTVSELRTHLQKTLPDYMVPNIFMFMDSYPTLPNGKIDFKSLPEPTVDRAVLSHDLIEPRNEREKILQEIWCELLNIPDIGIKDNFFELGGDSILSIQVVARANQRGVKITPKQLFEYPTIEGLASVAQEGIAIHAEQGLVTGDLPLTPIQQAFFDLNLPVPGHWNQALALELKQPLDLVALKLALQKIIKQHDMLRASFSPQKATIHSECSLPFFEFDLSPLTGEHLDEELFKVAEQLQAPFELNAPPLWRVGFIKMPEGKDDILQFVFHHLIIDGISWRILIEDILNVYQQITMGNTPKLPPKSTSFKYWANKLQVYAKSKILDEELLYWQNILQNVSNQLPLDFPEGQNTEATAKSITLSLTESESNALLKEAPRAYQTQVNELMITALARALHRFTGHPQLSIDLEGHGREDLFEDVDISRTVGWFTSSYPFAFNFNSTLSIDELIKLVKETYRNIPRNGIGFGILRYLRGEKGLASSLPTIAFNYLGQFDQNQDEILGTPVPPLGMERAEKNPRSHTLEIGGSVNHGVLTMHFSYSENQFKEDTIRNFAEIYMEELRSVINHCLSPDAGGYTISDFKEAGLDEDELNELFDELE